MATDPFKRRQGPTRGTPKEMGLTLWQQREKVPGIDWKVFDQVTLRAAIAGTLAAGGALMFSQAAGGMGVCVTAFLGNGKAKEYANSNEQLRELLDALIDFVESPAEDLRASMGGAGGEGSKELEA